MPFDPPVWRDFTPGFDITAEKLDVLGSQYGTVAADIHDPSTPVGAAVALAIAQALADAGVGGGYTDNGDGSFAIKPGWSTETEPGILSLTPGWYTDNGDGTLTLGG